MGQRVEDVWRQSYALTLYTLWQLQQLHAHEQFERDLGQHDLATLVAFAFNAPKELGELRERFLSRHTSVADAERGLREATLRARLAAHRRLVPVVPVS